MKIITTTERETTWADLKKAAKNHELRSGDKIPITLKNGEEAVLVIGHDEKGKAYFIFEDCLSQEHCINGIQCWLDLKVFALLPDEVQNLIVPTTRIEVINGERIENKGKLFLLSRTEVFGKGDYTKYEPEDTHIDIFPTEKSRVKECGDHGTWPWWLGSPSSGNTNYFCYVDHNGNAHYSYAGNSRGVAPAFCLSES